MLARAPRNNVFLLVIADVNVTLID